MQHRLRRVAAVLTLAFLMAGPATAQVAVTSHDILRLQDTVFDISDEIARVSDSRENARLRDELNTLREEVIYLKVKLRKQGSVERSEYVWVRDQLQNLRSRAAAAAAGRVESRREVVGTTGRTSTGALEVPARAELDIRLVTTLSSETAQVEDRVQATTIVDLRRDGEIVIPSGSTVRGIVTSVERATRFDRKGSLTLAFDQIIVNGRSYDIDARATQVFESEGLEAEAERIGAGAAVGGIIGGILGGVKGALAGILIGGGGTVLATEGKDVKLPEGTVMRIRFDRTLTIGR